LEHLLNTPSASITDELDPKKGPKSPPNRSFQSQKPRKRPNQKFAIMIVAIVRLIVARQFTLCRPDIMPVTDYGVRKGFQVLYRKRTLPTPKQLLKLTERWRPHRSLAALYLWRIAETAKKPKKNEKNKKNKNHFLNRSSKADFDLASSASFLAT
jgi:hypothetical protein